MVTRNDYDILQSYYGEVTEFLKAYLDLRIMQRLKDVGMLCGIDHASHNYKYFEFYTSRYDHSFGTAMVVWKLTHNKKWTLAALFHDVSTPVFSHVIDFVNGDYVEQESTEAMTNEVLSWSLALPDLLARDGMEIRDIVDFKDYSIVDLPRPKMCADRLNNVMTVGMGWIGSLDLTGAKYIVDHIGTEINSDGELELSFTDSKAAEIYINTNDSVNDRLALPEDDFLTDLLVKIVKRCLDKRYISYDNLFRFTESEMWLLIEYFAIDDQVLAEMYTTFTTIKDIPDIEVGHDLKKRDVNPLVKGLRYNK